MFFRGYLYIALGLCSLVACNEPIDLKTTEEGGQVVVDGNINNGTEGNQVRITLTQQTGIEPQPISGLIVMVYDDLGNEAQLIESNAGLYTLESNKLVRETGRTIWMEFEYKSRSYRSNPQVMQEIIAKDEITWEVNIEKRVSTGGAEFEEEVVRVYANTVFQDLPEEFYLRWKIEEVYTVLEANLPPQNFVVGQGQCFVWKDLGDQQIFLLNGEKIRNVNLNNRELVARRVDRTFSKKHYFNLVQMAITRETHDYWERVNSLTTRAGSVFDVPPAAIPGNVLSSDPNEVVLGTFDVMKIDTARTFLTNDDILYFFQDPCFTGGAVRFRQLLSVPYNCRQCLVDEFIMPEECIDCLSLDNSTYQRPSYF